ncbi:hypothetical protein AVP42_00476 [Agromyces sp. NDB4Y10]|uniref:hypothetical protein n=1 Tax=Agromyces sp. NDB4Y10 TaxID=1775951 RepID=UPI0007B20157|nr:hypothetical protein [Agromyces sp. NDB4Y10]KZE95188.1 hypothetical protein AVP42_00476 [Agromyces sp. NDB4Y10]
MAEKPIKVDQATDRVVTELAFFLRCTKKSVVAAAVAEYAAKADSVRAAMAAGPERPTMLALAPLDRLALRRGELIRAFAARNAADIRVAEFKRESMGASDLVLLAETDPLMSGAGEATRLSRIASDLLHVHVEVLCLRTMRRFAPASHRTALELSRPL